MLNLPVQHKNIGLYPIVSSSYWVSALAGSGVTTMQLRIKDLEPHLLKEEINRSISIARAAKIKLYINDHWQLALEQQAFGVHLGQEDLRQADISKIRQGGLHLGISTHSQEELSRALAYQPNYIALGPIFPTSSKIMNWLPQGVARLQEWQKRLKNLCQLVAIGGINQSNIDQVIASGVRNIAMISAITAAENPLATISQFVDKIRND